MAAPIDWERVWQQVRKCYGAHYGSALIFLPAPGKAVRVRVLPTDASHARAFDEFSIDGRTSQIVGFKPYRDLSPGARVLVNMDPIHTGALFGLPGRILIAISSLCLPLFFITGLLMYWKRRRRPPSRHPPADASADPPSHNPRCPRPTERR